MTSLMAMRRRVMKVAASGPLVSDSFNRPDSTMSLGTADTGQVWSVLAGAWGIDTNRAYSVGTTVGDRQVVVETGKADGTVVGDLAVLDPGGGAKGPGLLSRAVDASNYWIFIAEPDASRWALYKRVAGSHTLVASATETIVAARLSIPLSGSSITCKVGGVTKITTTDTAHQAATRHGFRDFRMDVSASRFDNFEFTAP